MVFRDTKINDVWSVREIVAPDGTMLPRKYFYKRNPAYRVELDSRLALQLAGYALIEKDLRSTTVWLKEIERLTEGKVRGKGIQISSDRERYNIVKGLWVAALTFYGKAFTSADGRGVSLDKKIIDQEYRDAHDRFTHMRHNFAAHSGEGILEQAKIAFAMPPNKKAFGESMIFREIAQADYHASDQIENELLFLAEHVHKKVAHKIDLLSNKIYGDEILPKGLEHWYSKAKK